MCPKDFEIGTKFRNKQTNMIIEVVKIDGEFLFECCTWGDLWDWVDEHLYTEIYE